MSTSFLEEAAAAFLAGNISADSLLAIQKLFDAHTAHESDAYSTDFLERLRTRHGTEAPDPEQVLAAAWRLKKVDGRPRSRDRSDLAEAAEIYHRIITTPEGWLELVRGLRKAYRKGEAEREARKARALEGAFAEDVEQWDP